MTKVEIDWIELVIGLVIVILAILAIYYGAEQMQSQDVAKISFYAILAIMFIKKLYDALDGIIESVKWK